MTYDTAIAIGKECGLNHPSECVNNILIHAIQLFTYDTVGGEIEELRLDARRNGVRFSRVCGDAIMEDHEEDELCYMCRSIFVEM